MSEKSHSSPLHPRMSMKQSPNLSAFQSQSNVQRCGDIYKDDDDDENIQDVEMSEQQVRQDLYMVFVNEKDLRHHETISIKASLFKGIAVRIKDLN